MLPTGTPPLPRPPEKSDFISIFARGTRISRSPPPGGYAPPSRSSASSVRSMLAERLPLVSRGAPRSQRGGPFTPPLVPAGPPRRARHTCRAVASPAGFAAAGAAYRARHGLRVGQRCVRRSCAPGRPVSAVLPASRGRAHHPLPLRASSRAIATRSPGASSRITSARSSAGRSASRSAMAASRLSAGSGPPEPVPGGSAPDSAPRVKASRPEEVTESPVIEWLAPFSLPACSTPLGGVGSPSLAAGCFIMRCSAGT